jgi:hypothetical protein
MPDARLGQQVLGVRRVELEPASELANGSADIFHALAAVRAPNGAKDFLVGHTRPASSARTRKTP